MTHHEESVSNTISVSNVDEYSPGDEKSFNQQFLVAERKRHTDPPVTVLVIDDDPDQLVILKLLLEREHYRVLAAENTEEAKSYLKLEEISCVISDVFMPVKSGTDFISELRTLPEYANLPVILLTAGTKDLEWRALHSGADMFCQKKDAKSLLTKQLRLLLG